MSQSESLFDLVICTHGRPDTIMESVEKSRDEFAGFANLIVIDNNIEPMSGQVRRYLEQFNFIIHHQPTLGLSNARNMALEKAPSKYVYFIDDDASLGEGFADALLKFSAKIRDEGIEPIFGGGLIKAAYYRQVTPVMSEFELSLLSCMGDNFHYPWGANMFVHRTKALEVGGFDARLGWVKESSSLLGEEDDLFMRLREQTKGEAGAPHFIEGAYVNHWIPEWRLSPKWLRTRAYKGGRSNYLVYKTLSRKELPKLCLSFLKNPSREKKYKILFEFGKYAQKYYYMDSNA